MNEAQTHDDVCLPDSPAAPPLPSAGRVMVRRFIGFDVLHGPGFTPPLGYAIPVVSSLLSSTTGSYEGGAWERKKRVILSAYVALGEGFVSSFPHYRQETRNEGARAAEGKTSTTTLHAHGLTSGAFFASIGLLGKLHPCFRSGSFTSTQAQPRKTTKDSGRIRFCRN